MTDETEPKKPAGNKDARAGVRAEKYYSSAEVAEILGISRSTLTLYKREGKVTPADASEMVGKNGAEVYPGSRVLRYLDREWDAPVSDRDVDELPFGSYSKPETARILRLTVEELNALVESQWLQPTPEGRFRVGAIVNLIAQTGAKPVYAHWYWGDDSDTGEKITYGYSVDDGDVIPIYKDERPPRMYLTPSVFGFQFPGGPTRVPNNSYGQVDDTADYRMTIWHTVLQKQRK